MEQQRLHSVGGGFGWPWFALTVAFALHVFDEATTGFLAVYNPTVIAMRARWGWFPMPTFEFREWLVALIFGVAVCFALTPLAARGVGSMRPLAWFYAVIQVSNAMGHTIGTILGHTVASVTFSRPAPGFYSSPFLFIGSVWLMVRLRKTAASAFRLPERTSDFRLRTTRTADRRTLEPAGSRKPQCLLCYHR